MLVCNRQFATYDARNTVPWISAVRLLLHLRLDGTVLSAERLLPRFRGTQCCVFQICTNFTDYVLVSD